MPSATLISSVPHFVSREEHRTIAAETPSHFTDIPPDSAQGTLYIIESVLVFMSTTGRGFQIEYPAITLHAVSRAEAGPSIYCQLDEHAGEAEAAASNDEMTTCANFQLCLRALHLVLEPIFEALSRCAALHPDKATPSDDEKMDAFIDADSGGFEVFTGDEDQELSEVGRAALAHLESIIYYPEDQPDTNGVVNGDAVADASDEENVNASAAAPPA
ncbi:regulator of volume decrease after cellular swelling-domain-containing protein [Mycena rosella]|uniref:Regulator of volume decrease after cellular swelling-domain-containing protein n=1 Tax=Mycena rosella TaxID=1033263 RepID=A0AAD7D4D0_MYCRO|nr:regulator of volume decrease after cellular swelling-domain-containing protein [Mycena rosella]